MFRLRLLSWEYGVRNLLRRPSRSALTLVALTTVILLVFVVVGFIRGLERSLAVSGDPSVVLVYSMGAFVLRIDGVSLMIGCGVGLILEIVGALPPAIKALRLPVAESLKAIG